MIPLVCVCVTVLETHDRRLPSFALFCVTPFLASCDVGLIQKKKNLFRSIEICTNIQARRVYTHLIVLLCIRSNARIQFAVFVWLICFIWRTVEIAVVFSYCDFHTSSVLAVAFQIWRLFEMMNHIPAVCQYCNFEWISCAPWVVRLYLYSHLPSILSSVVPI